MKGVILDELLIIVGNVVNLNEIHELAVPPSFPSQATFPGGRFTPDICWGGSLSFISKPQITGLFPLSEISLSATSWFGS